MSRTKVFPVAELREILSEGNDVVLDELVEKSRWSLLHRLVFRHEGTLFETHYSVGATEYQNEGPWEGEKEVKCKEVESYEKVVIDYRPVS